MNLFDTLNEALTDEVVSKIALISEEDPEKTRKALDGIFYTLIAGLIRRTGSTMSVSMLFNQIQKGNQGGELIGNVLSYLNKNDKLETISRAGEGLISQIFPAYKSPLVSMIGTYAGIKKSSSTMYSSIAAPILIDAVSKEIDTNELDIDGLITFLGSHHEALFELAPEELLEKMIPQLGLQELLLPKFLALRKIDTNKNFSTKNKHIIEDINNSKNITVSSEEKVSSTVSIKFLLIGLIIASVIGGGVYWYSNFYRPSLSDVPSEALVIDSTALEIDTITKPIIDSVAVQKLADTALLGSKTNPSFSSELSSYLLDETQTAGRIFELKGLEFIKGTQALNTGANGAINELAELMLKYPKLQIQLRGRSNDAVGMNNQTMAIKRAFVIKRKLLEKGITSTRIDAIGTKGTNNGADFRVVSK